MNGLLVNGVLHKIDGLNILAPGEEPWVKLDSGDYCSRSGSAWVHQIICHTTKGDWPQKIVPGAGPGGRDKVVADFWRGDPTHSAAQLVVDNDGTVACLCDLQTTLAYHATVSNPWSVGIEGYQEAGGVLYGAMLDAYVKLVVGMCRIMGIQFQIPKLPYANKPLQRMVRGGANAVGVFGHRDNTVDRGRGDPGDELFVRLRAAGAEAFDFDAGEDLAVWKKRQEHLISKGHMLTADGVPGPATTAALKAEGFVDGIWALNPGNQWT